MRASRNLFFASNKAHKRTGRLKRPAETEIWPPKWFPRTARCHISLPQPVPPTADRLLPEARTRRPRVPGRPGRSRQAAVRPRSRKVEAIEVHNFAPGRHKVMYERGTGV